jgi:hypothetical protein
LIITIILFCFTNSRLLSINNMLIGLLFKPMVFFVTNHFLGETSMKKLIAMFAGLYLSAFAVLPVLATDEEAAAPAEEATAAAPATETEAAKSEGDTAAATSSDTSSEEAAPAEGTEGGEAAAEGSESSTEEATGGDTENSTENSGE